MIVKKDKKYLNTLDIMTLLENEKIQVERRILTDVRKKIEDKLFKKVFVFKGRGNLLDINDVFGVINKVTKI